MLVLRRPQDNARSKYKLVTSRRTHLGADDEAFNCMGVAEDKVGREGVFLQKTVIAVAGRALVANLKALLPTLLPWHEQVKRQPLRDSSLQAQRNYTAYVYSEDLPNKIPLWKFDLQGERFEPSHREVFLR